MLSHCDRKVASSDSVSQPLFRSPSPGDPHPLTEGNSAVEATSSPPHTPGQTKPKHSRRGRQAAARSSRDEIQFRRGVPRFLRKARSPHLHPTTTPGDRGGSLPRRPADHCRAPAVPPETSRYNAARSNSPRGSSAPLPPRCPLGNRTSRKTGSSSSTLFGPLVPTTSNSKLPSRKLSPIPKSPSLNVFRNVSIFILLTSFFAF